MNYEILATDLKSIMKRGYNLQLLQGIVSLLAADWLLIYKIDNDILVLTLTRTGTHSDLF